MSSLLRELAQTLRHLAYKLDGVRHMPESVNRIGVMAMNQYIGQTEHYIVDLEACLAKNVVARLRDVHGRFDTKRMVDAGAWKDTRDCAGGN